MAKIYPLVLLRRNDMDIYKEKARGLKNLFGRWSPGRKGNAYQAINTGKHTVLLLVTFFTECS